MFQHKFLQQGRAALNLPVRPLISSTRDPLDLELKVIYGELPDDITGHVFINSSSGSVNSPYPYPEKNPDGSRNKEYGSPILLGGGFVMRYDFDQAGKAFLKARLLKPPAYYADEATKEGSHPHYPKWKQSISGFKNLGITRLSFWLGCSDLLSTAITPIRYGNDKKDRLVATTDVGRPYEFDPKTLQIKTPIGYLKEYINGVPGIVPWPFPVLQTTAHPAFDPVTKELFSVNYTKSTSLQLKESNLWPTLHLHHDKIEKELEEKVKSWKTITDKNEAREKLNEYFQNVHQNRPTHESKFQRFFRKLKHTFTKVLGDIFSFFGVPENEFSVKDEVYLHCFDGSPSLKSWRMVDEKGENLKITQCCHQTTLSEDYFVFIDAAFKLSLDVMFNNPFPHNPEIDNYIRKVTSVPQEPYTYLYIVARKDLNPASKTVVAKQIKLEPEFIHCYLNYKNPNGKLTLYGASNSAACLAEWVRPFDKLVDGSDIEPGTAGIISAGVMDIGRISKYEIDGEKGNLLSESILDATGNLDKPEDLGAHTWGVGIYTFRDIISGSIPSNEITDIFFQCYGLEPRRLTEFIYELYKEYPNRKIPAEKVKQLSEEGIPHQVVRLNAQSFELEDYFQFPKGYEIRSLQFTHRKGSVNPRPGIDGYITVLMINEDELDGVKNFFREVWIFDAANLKQGPKAVLSHPDLNYAFTLHSVWTDSLESNDEDPYTVPVKEDYQYMIDKIWLDKHKIQDFFEKEIYPHFN
ncbi:MAG: lignostilbene-alpha,beta-dioxygenase related protein [Algoriphagus marincola HL-49]|uniref:Lignostilbene-alpha,beta-dioxygenase related protein n=1 Tax=Algoriphagus marincola HL-49 TaxID=1305737 RepID=A0A0P8C312_9BACT|nr:MAG: lignostilbene-alpha,beta-dioxygenase related protein [Algoriphagus marincola HL-49]